MKGFVISKNLRYAFEILNFQHVDILARCQVLESAIFDTGAVIVIAPFYLG